MLRQLVIRNYSLIEHLDIEFNGGLTVLTGETGAGKSVVLDALALVLGDRADSACVRSGARRAEIVAVFSTEDNESTRNWLAEHGFEPNEDCYLRRVLTSDGRSRAWINGQPMPLQELRTLGEKLLDLHGQHEHQLLLKRSTHTGLLDAYGGHTIELEAVSAAWSKWHQIANELEKLTSLKVSQEEKGALLQYQLQELDATAVSEQEYGELSSEQRRLANAEEIGAVLSAVIEQCGGSETESIEAQLRHSQRQLSRIPDCGAELIEARELLDTAQIQVMEALDALNRLREGVHSDPERLAVVDARLAEIHALARKHRVTPDSLFSHHEQLAKEFEALRATELGMGELESELLAATSEFKRAAELLGKARRKAASSLAKQVQSLLRELAMDGCRFEVSLTPLSGDPDRKGGEAIEFLVSTLPDSPPAPLARVASGGELSRISLAIQVVTAETTSIPSIVFDEVDVGIGGKTASIVGRLLRRLGRHSQVFCVTHLAQVAACGHHHILVSKRSSSKSLAASLSTLDEASRSAEIARMLGGPRDTARKHAEELLALRQVTSD